MLIPDIDRRNSVCLHSPLFKQVVFDNEPCDFKDEVPWFVVTSVVIMLAEHIPTYNALVNDSF